MGGRIWVESEVGTGSVFHFTIAAEAAPEAASRAHLLGEQPALRGKRLLIVDDNATNRRIVAQYARSWGMVPIETASAREALDWIARGDPFDIAVLDVAMPEMDGVSLATEIRRHRDAPSLPLIFLSSMGRRESGSEAVDVAAYLMKPLKPSSLFNALTTVFAGETGGGVTGCARLNRRSIRRWPATAAAHPPRRGQRRKSEAGPAPPGSDGVPRRRGGERPGGDRGDGPAALRRDPDGRPDAGDGRAGGNTATSAALVRTGSSPHRGDDRERDAGRPETCAWRPGWTTT